jgi:hypothetical protein
MRGDPLRGLGGGGGGRPPAKLYLCPPFAVLCTQCKAIVQCRYGDQYGNASST